MKLVMKNKVLLVAFLTLMATTFSSIAEPVKKKGENDNKIIECQPFPECLGYQEPFIVDGVIAKFPELFKGKRQLKAESESLKRKKNSR